MPHSSPEPAAGGNGGVLLGEISGGTPLPLWGLRVFCCGSPGVKAPWSGDGEGASCVSMKTLMDSTDGLPVSGALDDEVMEDAAINGGENRAPEVSRETAEMTEWDGLPGAAGRQVPDRVEGGEETEAEKLVRAGIEEAAREQRVATGVVEGDYPTE